MRMIYRKIKDWLFDIRMQMQRKTRGYSDSEIWNLDNTICQWILPRLKAFREHTFCYPAECDSLEDWQDLIDRMIFGFEWLLEEDGWYEDNISGKTGEEKDANVSEYRRLCTSAEIGREIFGKWMTHLWW